MLVIVLPGILLHRSNPGLLFDTPVYLYCCAVILTCWAGLQGSSVHMSILQAK